MIRFLLHLIQGLLTFVVILILVMAMGLLVLKPYFDRELQSFIKHTQGRNVEISFFDYGKVRLSGLGIILKHVRARGATRIQHPYFEPREFDLSVESMRVGLQRFQEKSFEVDIEISGMDIKGGRMFRDNPDDHERLESISGLNLQTRLVLKGLPFFWKDQLLNRGKEFKAWAFDNQPIQNLKLEGKAVFVVDDWPVKTKFHSVANANGFVRLEGDAEDMREIAKMIEPKFTDSDIELASKNLLKTPRLLNIRTKAEMQAIRLKGRDPEIVYDVPRHIYWSYWLAKTFGEVFAREATNAHEIGDELNSSVESDKDRHHNALGIEYAGENYSEKKVEEMIFSDKRVIRKKKNRALASSNKNTAKPIVEKRTAL